MMSSTRLRNSGLKCRLSSSVHLALHAVVRRRRVALHLETDRTARDVAGTEVGRHDDHSVLEVDDPSLTIGQTTLLEDLEERVEDVGVRLLDLVEQDDRERLAPYLLSQLAAFLEADESRGAPNSRETVCFSPNSDMSSAINAASSSKRNSASAFASPRSFPTPVGPAKMNEPEGRSGSLRPAADDGSSSRAPRSPPPGR